MSRVLVGDLGAPNPRLAIASRDDGPRRWVAREDFRSRDHASLEELVRAFLSRTDLPVSEATFGIAGPVLAGRASITNLPWVIDTVRLQTACGLPVVTVVNDVQALAHALLVLGADDLHTVNPGEPVRGGAMAVIAPGTGLGEAFVIWDGRRYRACASEGGHADFAPRDRLQVELLAYLYSRFDHVSYERVCAGPGIPNIYGYLKEHGGAPEPRWLAEQLRSAGDPTPVIVAAALQEAAPALCRTTLEMFVSILGAEAGNLALKALATGGVYLGGGIPRRILSVLTGEHFVTAFQRKGRLAQLLEHVPLHVILNPDAGLIGAAVYGLVEP